MSLLDLNSFREGVRATSMISYPGTKDPCEELTRVYMGSYTGYIGAFKGTAVTVTVETPYTLPALYTQFMLNIPSQTLNPDLEPQSPKS